MNKRLFITLLAVVLFLLSLFPVAAHDTFPITVEHKYGSTTIAEAPERVVSIGYTDQDAILALGVTPVAVRYWYGDETNAVFPWARDKVEGETPAVLQMGYGSLNYEAILELDPDLIIAVYSGITEDEYKLLSEIAPTIAQTADYIDFGMPWQATTQLVGSALGRSDEAGTLVGDVEAAVESAAAANPEFAGKTIAVAYNFSGNYGFYTSQDSRGRFFTDLGFVIPDELVEIAGESFFASLSAETLQLLDQDVLVFVGLQFVEGGRETIEADPLLSQLDVVKEGRTLFVPGNLDDALQFNTVLSLPYLLSDEGLVPELQALLGVEATPES